ncbi:MAG: Acidobacterial duplicated orphan permease (function unknown) [uncultured Segetibacter sp.]|uniref:ABC transporter, permease protein n=1 Tax=uncultured Segetibacter sp. TaxID=481133 RepID=A0A6J4SM55_9BACT|nr:MAG: Acidobacterial duplicated orphan permease (function unknown) [uncultured Segetibacter sp.]
MFKSYFSTAIKNIKRNPGYTSLNVFGLTLGIASCLVIFLVVRNELGYDSFHRKANRTYRVTLNALDFNSNVSLAVVPALRNDFPDLELTSQVFYQQTGMVKVGQSRYNEKGYAFADEHLQNIFDFKWLAGNLKNALSEPNTVVLTESIARKYFGEKEVIGRVINLNNQFDLKVTGLIKDQPGNTHMPFLFLVSLKTIDKELQGGMSNFYSIPGGSYAYLVIPEKYSIEQLQKKIPAFIEKNWGKDIAKEATLPLQPLRDIHFDQRYINNIITPTSRDTYWALAGVALFIIITACINFINLATAQSIRRAKEVGVRKVLGANRSQLIIQFLGETALLILLALCLALIATSLFLPHAAKWLDIKIDLGQLAEPTVAGLLTFLTLLVILLAGLYPAFVQSAFSPAESFKNTKGLSIKGLTLRKSLVVVQFAISQILIVGTLVVAYQMDFFQNQHLGFNKEAVVSFDVPDEAKREVLRQQLLANPGVKDLSFSSGAPMYNNNFTSFSSRELGLTKDDVTEVKSIDERYTAMFELKMLAGEQITKPNEKDTIRNVVVNETLIHKLGIREPEQAIGKQITLNGNEQSTIIGVVQDFQSESKHKKIRATVLKYDGDEFFRASVRVQPKGITQTIGQINKSWSALFPDNLFEYEFLDDHIASLYQQEQREYIAFKLFSCIAIIIGCLGLYGLVAFAAVQRTKEVGIRKVLGASLFRIVSLFAKEFIVLIAIAFLIAAPIAYHIMHNWLQNFAYQVTISVGIFLIAIGASFTIAALTIAYQAIKAAIANPIKSLRTE